MFSPTKVQVAFIRSTLGKIMEDSTNESFAQAWLVWAELHLQTLDRPDKSVVVTRLMPLIMACVATSNKTSDQAQKIIHDSVLKVLFQAKLSGKDSLDMEEARKAAVYVKYHCQ
jgi:hypothetical protein